MENGKHNLSPDELVDAAYRVPLEDWTISDKNYMYTYFEAEVDGIQIGLGRGWTGEILTSLTYDIEASSKTVNDRTGNPMSVGRFSEKVPFLFKSKESEHLRKTRELYHTLQDKFNGESLEQKELAVAAAREGLAGLVEKD